MKSFVGRNSKCIGPEPEMLQRGEIHAAGRITLMLGGLILGGFAGTLAIAQGTLSAKAPISPEAMAIHVQAKRHVAQPVTTLEPAVALAATASTVNSAQGPRGGAIGPGPGCDLLPGPPSVGASIPLSYFGPPPSTTNPILVGPVQLLNYGMVDAAHVTITIPLYTALLAGSHKHPLHLLTYI